MWDVPLLDPRALLLEKECVLVESFYGSDFPENENCLLVTGRGVVNEQTKAFMKYFSQYHRNGTTDLKIQGLTDMGQEGACIIAYLDNIGNSTITSTVIILLCTSNGTTSHPPPPMFMMPRPY